MSSATELISEQRQSLSNGTIHYWTYHADQPGPALIFLHGFSGNHHGLAPVVELLPQYRIIAPDLPGFGDSPPLAESLHTVADYAVAVAEFIAALKLAEPPVLVGHSLGSVVAARVAVERPELVAGQLILLSPTSTSPFADLQPRYVGARLGELHYAFGAGFGALGEWWLHRPVISRFTTWALLQTPDRALRRRVYEHHIRDLGYLRHRRVFRDAYRSLNRDGVINYASAITQQTLMIAGANDTMWPASTQQQVVAKLKHGQLVLLPGVGHLTHFEAPQALAAAITAFLSGADPAAAVASGHVALARRYK